MGSGGDKPWWMRLDGLPPRAEAPPRRWTAREVRTVRIVMAITWPLTLVLAVYGATTRSWIWALWLLHPIFGWLITPAATRDQILGRHDDEAAGAGD